MYLIPDVALTSPALSGGGACFLRQVLELRPALPADLHRGGSARGAAAVSLGAVGFEVRHRSHDAPGPGGIFHGKTMGKPWENHWKTMGNHGKTMQNIGKWQ